MMATRQGNVYPYANVAAHRRLCRAGLARTGDTRTSQGPGKSRLSDAVLPMTSTQQKADTKPVPEKTDADIKEVSQDGFDYVLNAMNGEDNMKEETKDYKPTKTWGSYFFGSSKK
ncbi:g4991 [Coccomyxa viridis]|uniref:G4991 protein n=1 Tax=Coccomyxa viridis TaxID=1274662 RepID=A0ABP1FVN1_9CHLO